MPPQREKILNLPEVVTGLIVLLGVIQALVAYAPDSLADGFFETFALIPARLSYLSDPDTVIRKIETLDAYSPVINAQVAAVLGARPFAYVTLFSYAFLHGGWTHYFVNALTLAAFGAPVARRLGASAFLSFVAACAVAGGVLHFTLHPLDFTPMIGASAAISGTMAAIVRFAFEPGARLGEIGRFDGRGNDHVGTTSLWRLRENRQAMIFVVAWFGVNFLMGAFPQFAGSTEAVAWEAHIGGFLFGLFSFDAFERLARRR